MLVSSELIRDATRATRRSSATFTGPGPDERRAEHTAVSVLFFVRAHLYTVPWQSPVFLLRLPPVPLLMCPAHAFARHTLRRTNHRPKYLVPITCLQ